MTKKQLCGLDGIFFRVKCDGRFKNVCLSDMTHDERMEKLNNDAWNDGALRKTEKHLIECFMNVTDFITKCEELQDSSFIAVYKKDTYVDDVLPSLEKLNREQLLNLINYTADELHWLGESFGIRNVREDEDE